MANQGQIVEIPANSPLYTREIPTFLSKKERLSWESKKNPYSLFDGFLVGGHSGVEHFKIGQRKGINVGGKKEPLYVIQIDQKENRLFVGAGEKHPGLWTKVISFDVKKLQWKEGKSFSAEELENGIPIELATSVLEKDLQTLFYIFNEEGYFEFEKPVSIIIKEHPIQLIYDNKIIANIN